jgi:hypothetical protein
MYQIISVLLDLDDVPLHLRASTRGRSDNPSSGRKGTKPSTIELNFGTGDHILDLRVLIEGYRSYFGLILSHLYDSRSSEERLETKARTSPSPNKHSLL